MRRYLSIWFPDWPLDRLRRARRQPSAPLPTARPVKPHPFVLYEKAAHGLVVAVGNPPVLAAGIYPGLPLTDARSAMPDLVAEEIDRDSDARALKELAAWMVRFSPLVAMDGIDGLMLETTGCDHPKPPSDARQAARWVGANSGSALVPFRITRVRAGGTPS